jgi:uncharacterized protein YcaQ
MVISLTLDQARRLAVRSQRLAGPVDGGLRDVLRSLRCLQLDPVNTVTRSHLLVLWSRLGAFSRAELDALLREERWLFEYWAHAASIVLTEDYELHRPMMLAYPAELAKREWLAANESFRSYLMELLAASGPLPILHGDRLIGRVAPRIDRKKRILVVEGVFAEPSAPASAGPATAASLDSLAAVHWATVAVAYRPYFPGRQPPAYASPVRTARLAASARNNPGRPWRHRGALPPRPVSAGRSVNSGARSDIVDTG